MATGVQIDNTFTGFVLDNGPGASTLSLRGIDPERTLVLINGRRLGPGGVEGAPTSPDLNLIPSSLIGRVEVLLDGASSIYGSDAVAGVANIILRDDFDGFELETAFSVPETGGGKTSQVSATWGVTGDRGFIGVGAEFFRRDQMSVADRGLLCNEHIEIDENGQRRSLEVDVFPGTTINTCKTQIIGRFRNLFSGQGDIFFTPGQSNTGIPNYSDDIDLNGDGLRDVDVKAPLYNGIDPSRDLVRNQDLISQLERISFMAFGNYELQELNNMETFFEVGYFQRDSVILSSGAQIFPTLPAWNPLNPCGDEAVAANPSICGGLGVGVPVVPIVLVNGDRNNNEVTQSQIRLVGGIRGELPFFDGQGGGGFIDFNNWTYELSGSYQRSFGDSVRRGILEDRLALSLLTTTRLPDGSLACGIDPDGDGIPNNIGDFDLFGFLGGPDCVPVDLLSESVQGSNRLTPEEEEYLFGVRTFSTEIQQSIISGFITGNIAQLPGGQAALVLGFEYRQDEIQSRPDDNAEDGNFIGFFSDRGATGRRELKEGYGELDLPLLRNRPFFEELSLNFSGRLTNETFYGSNWTWSFKGLWRPFDWLAFRGSRGTSFRAPNLREQFFRGATGFVNAFNDPCIVPAAANNGGVYDPTGDNRNQTTIDNCILDGVDPFSLGLTGASSIEVLTGGTTDLDAETSRSFTGGVVLDVPFDTLGVSDDLRFQISATHFDIKVTNTIEEPSVAFLFNDCYVNNAGLSSAFCGRITRDPATGFVDLVDAGFINIGRVTVRGFDFNTLLGATPFSIGNDPVDFTLDVRSTFIFEQEEEIIDSLDDNIREVGNPRWRGQGTAIADWRNWRALWRARYIGPQVNDAPSTFGARDTCRPIIDLSGARDTSDVLCRDVDFVKSYWVHNAAVTWRNDVWSVTAGINNVFDRDPPKADSAEVLVSAAGNFPLGVGYDFFGRTYTLNVRRQF
ncbi:TonB-dependent receptor domain-containing protein [Amphiplicatus metriothermophilus]|uniref:TonB-dependent receptor domain-containing protein n=1 Tax=Amphiplicatus metriothermophilus TaxID=1519374 RepID=UPI0013577FEB|nr:TonB-dependent receptor [Amphiplicatus metriothermophilus]MBB5518344.1 iron complex outermembrane receptor protein [Amphiplicatus metriothermophilus]